MITVTALHKRYGTRVALDGMTFEVRPGEVTGFIGPNGAGKSTTMRVILGLDAPDNGKATIGGKSYQSLPNPLRTVGALLDANALEPTRSARNHLLWLAASQDLPPRRVDEVLEQVGLESEGRRAAGGFSFGMRQRLGIAAALLGSPQVLIMDEPFNGMDPEGFVWLRGLLRSLAAHGCTVFVSSHLMGELQDIADHLVIVGRGKVIADTTVEELISRTAGERVTVRTARPDVAMALLTAAGASVTTAGPGMLAVVGCSSERILALLGEQHVAVSEVSVQRTTLEQAYLELTRQAVEYRARPGAEAEQ